MIPPLVITALRSVLPYAIAASVGFACAWWLQGLRVTAAQQEFTQYKQDQKDAVQAAKDKAEQDRVQQGKEYADERKTLLTQIEAGEAFRRCVAAGKCGVRHVAACPTGSNGVSPTSGIDGTGTNTIPAPPGTTPPTGEGDPVVGDCAVTTLMLNRLQNAIESQPGF